MATLFVRHQAADYAAWRQVYDAFQPKAKALGVQADAVYQAAERLQNLAISGSLENILDKWR